MNTHETGGFFDLKLIPQFDGSHGQSVVEWLQTVELICKLRKVEDVASVIPLRLTGGALAVYLQLSDKERESVEKLKASLLAAFAVDPFIAYEEFKERNLRANELPDVFLADLRRLASLFGGLPEKAVACAFVSGLPDNVRQLLRAGARMEDLSLNQILTRARAIITDDRPSRTTDACLTAGNSEAKQQTGISAMRCYACGELNHFARDCLAQRRAPAAGQRNVGQSPRRKRRREVGISASLLPHCPLIEALPTAQLYVDGVQREVLVDTGCSKCVAHVSCCKRWRKELTSVIAVDGREFQCEGSGTAHLQVTGGVAVEVRIIVTHVNPLGFDFILGMNGITALGGVIVDDQRRVQLGLRSSVACTAIDVDLKLDERDFAASYSVDTRSWTAVWKWSEGAEPGVLRNTAEEYHLADGARAPYEKELETWIQNGWLIPYDESKYGAAKGLVPLMAVVQRNKSKVRPVMDFRELNDYIETHTADSDVCAQKLREWRRQGANVSVIDLNKAYLQIRIDESLWPYQTVVFKRRRYCLTRLGFGLNVAPLIMKAVVKCVLSQDPNVEKGTSAYIDDIMVNEDVVGAGQVEQHLARYGLSCKAHERVADGARVLGLRVWCEHGAMTWKRDNQVPAVPDRLTRRIVFSYCGKLVGHLPVCGWLRVATAFAKRKANDATASWDEVIDDNELRTLLLEIAAEVKVRDPAKGRWDVSGNEARVWVDASSLAVGVALEVGGSIVEDAAWLRRDEACHINMAELDAVIKGLNLALSWQMNVIELMTDSSTVHRWISDGLSGRTRLKTKAASEMLIRRRIGIVLSLVEECGLNLNISLVRSADNKADALTRIPRSWFGSPTKSVPVCAPTVDSSVEQIIAKIHHDAGHPGVRRTLYFARRVCPTVSKQQARQVVINCEACQSIDPAPVKWRHGRLNVEKVWQRLGMDITHFRGRPYLTLIDCGPSRFSIWRPLRLHTSADVAGQLETVFYEHGAPEELLTDNDTAFRSKAFAQLAARWDIRVRFRCAYVPSGNGMVERCHRTVKVIAARKGCSIEEAVYLYNITPRDDRTSQAAPANGVYKYAVRIRRVDVSSKEGPQESSPYAAGDAVWVKPAGIRCDRRYQTGTVTGVMSSQAVEVDGFPRHVRDLRPRAPVVDSTSVLEDSQDDELILTFPTRSETAETPSGQINDPPEQEPRRSARIRKPRTFTCCDCTSGGSVPNNKSGNG
uniref:RNA-directed DNA polymerase n=1 Tax=Trichuris muris TaxID=70415 RepID=A0A5S6QJ61_TRIMR